MQKQQENGNLVRCKKCGRIIGARREGWVQSKTHGRRIIFKEGKIVCEGCGTINSLET